MDEKRFEKVDSVDTDVEKCTIVDNVTAAPDTVGKNGPATHLPSRKLDLDTGEEHIRFRRHWWQIW